jgi:gliding motility-associated-like protein
MNFKKISLVIWLCIVALFLYIPGSLQAQCSAKFTIGTINGKTGDVVKVPITVENFTELSVLQWTIRWDPAVLEFIDVLDLDLPDLTQASFNKLRANQGYITTSWFNQSGATKTNGSVIFNISFRLIGADGRFSDVRFDNTPLKAEFADKNSQVCNGITLTNGKINIGTVVDPPPTGTSLRIGKVSGQKDAETCVPVTVTGFKSITAMQFSFAWDTARIKFTKLQNFKGLTQFDASSFGSSLAPRGQITCVWIDQMTTGQTVADNTAIFEICFRYTGACDATAAIDITDVPTRTSIVSSTGTLTTTKESGSLTGRCSAGNFTISASRVVQPCPGQNNGSIEITTSGGTGTPTFTWTNAATSKDLANVGPGTYNVTARDGAGNTATLANAITLAALTVTAQGTDPTGGQNNGAVVLTVSGGNGSYTYTWSNNATTKDINNLAAGSYTYTVRDGAGCTVTGTTAIGSNVALDITGIVPTAPACAGGSTGAISINIVGGRSPYTISWTGPNNFTSTNEDLTALRAGTYRVTVRDAANASKTSNDIVLTDPPALRVAGTTKSPTIIGNDGEINLSVSGGTPAYSYRWSDGSTQQNRTSLAQGNFTVNVTDSRGCTASTSFTLAVNNGACFTSNRVFSPNNDGINELLVISCIPGQNQLQIFNRWNQLVYSATNYSNDWNGISNTGTLLQDGTYYWILRDNTTNAIYKGYVSLLRALN